MRRKVLRFISWTCAFLPTAFWGLLIYGFDAPCVANLTLIAAAIHELGHECALLSLRKGARAPRAAVDGFRIKPGELLSYREQIAVLAAGPLFNIAAALIGAALIGVWGEYGYMLCGLNVLTAVSNLLPCEGLDGYGIIRASLEGRGLHGGLRGLEAVGVAVNIVILLSALFLMMRIGEGYWIFGLFLWNTVASLEKLRKRHTF